MRFCARVTIKAGLLLTFGLGFGNYTEGVPPETAADSIQAKIAALETEDLTVNRHAMADLVKLGPPAVESLIQSLRSDKQLTRLSAAEALGAIGDPRAVDPLLAMLQGDDYAGRWAAAEALGRIRDPRAVDPLIESLRGAQVDLRSAIVTALNQIGDPRAVPTLVKFLKDENPDTRISAARVVGRLGGAEVAPSLIPSLNDPAPEVRISAAEALGRLGAAEALEPLIAMLADDQIGVRLAAAAALGKIGDPRAMPPLVDALQPHDAEQRMVVAGAIGLLRDPAGTQPLIALLRDEREPVQAAAVAALEQMGSAAAPDLINCLGDYSSRICAIAARLLGGAGYQEARDPIVALLKHTDAGVRQAAAAALTRLGYTPETLEDRVTFYIADRDWRALADASQPAFDQLLTSLASENSAERILALDALEEVWRSNIAPLLESLRNTNASIRVFTAEALGNIGNKDAIEPLTALQNDENEYVRKYAARALNQLGREVPIPEPAPLRFEGRAPAGETADEGAVAAASGESATGEAAASEGAAASDVGGAATNNILGDIPLLTF